jgi:hypothetical protein
VELIEDGRNIGRAALNEAVARSGDRRGNGRSEGAERERGESSDLHEGQHGEKQRRLAVRSDERVLKYGGLGVKTSCSHAVLITLMTASAVEQWRTVCIEDSAINRRQECRKMHMSQSLNAILETSSAAQESHQCMGLRTDPASHAKQYFFSLAVGLTRKENHPLACRQPIPLGAFELRVVRRQSNKRDQNIHPC